MSFKKDVIFLMTMIIVTAKVIKCSTKSQKVKLNLVFFCWREKPDIRRNTTLLREGNQPISPTHEQGFVAEID